MSRYKNISIDTKGALQFFKILEQCKGDPHRFIFDYCKTKKAGDSVYSLTPVTSAKEDIVTARKEAPPGSLTVSYKKRQVEWTNTNVKYDVYDMFFNPLFTGYWNSIKGDSAKRVIDRIKGTVYSFDFYIPEHYKNVDIEKWVIQEYNREGKLIKNCKIQSFTQTVTNVTGEYPDCLILDEASKYDPPESFVQILAESATACQFGKRFANSTLQPPSYFIDLIQQKPVKGITYEEHISSFPIPTKAEWMRLKYGT